MGSRGTAEDLRPGQLSSPILNIMNPTSLPDPSGVSSILTALANGNTFRDMSGLSGTQGALNNAVSGTLDAATASGELTSANLKTNAQKAVAMAQVAADIAKAAMGVPSTGGSVQGISGDGARINHGKDMDERGVSNTPGNTNQGGENVEIDGPESTPETSPVNNDRMMTSSPLMERGFEAAAFNKTNWGGLGSSGSEMFEKMSEQSLFDKDPGLIALAGGGKGPKNGELTMYGHFVWDPPISDADEILLLTQGKWHPSILDFMAVTGVGAKNSVGDFTSIFGQIAEQPDGSVKRVNFFTHSNSTDLGLSGTMDPSNVFFTQSVDAASFKSQYNVAGLSITYGTKTFTIADVKKKFAENAIFVIYGCRAGAKTDLMKEINALLGVKVIGFTKEIIFCPPAQPGPNFIRKGIKIGLNKTGNCANDAVTDWRGLITDPNAVSIP